VSERERGRDQERERGEERRGEVLRLDGVGARNGGVPARLCGDAAAGAGGGVDTDLERLDRIIGGLYRLCHERSA
jgi:hypothetical protein